jgi:hypothetical protein
MRTIWKSSSAILALALAAFGAHADAGTPNSPARAPLLNARALHGIHAQRVTGQRLILTAENKATSLGLFVVRFDSKATGNGYCGAGSEDYLVLARLGKGSARPIASERIQSCLDTQSLYITDGDDFDALVRHLRADATRCAVTLEPMTEGKDPERVAVYIDAANGKLTHDPQLQSDSAMSCAAPR